jgi:methylornithine synthase
MLNEERLNGILESAIRGRPTGSSDTEFLLGLTDAHSIGRLFETARKIRDRKFGKEVFLYGFVYFTTHCRNDCSFCYYRQSNGRVHRYRKTREEVESLSSALKDSGVHLIDLTMGEDPLIHELGNWNWLVSLVGDVRGSAGIPIMVSPGVVPTSVLPRLREAGADWYACYQETHNRSLYSSLRNGQDYDVRMDCKIAARNSGMLIEEGIMVGVGETAKDKTHSIDEMARLHAQQVRAMTFVPQSGTPMSEFVPKNSSSELIAIAVMRLVLQDRLIPASLDIEGIEGAAKRISAGANVITSIIPPERGLAGVAQHDLDIETGARTVACIEELLDKMDTKVASSGRYRSYLCEARTSSEARV